MLRIGIDFSLNSPSMCADDGTRIRFYSFFNTEGLVWERETPLKKFQYHNKIKELVELVPYQRTQTDKKTSYSDEQIAKMGDAKKISELIIRKIEEIVKDETNFAISLEGFAYGSKGMSFIDLILFNSFLRKDIIDRFGEEKLIIIAPKEAKKLAGNGNASKEYMIDAFVKNKDEDELLESAELYKYLKSEELDYKNIKPIDDLVDAYWLMRTLKERTKECE